jgi:hypothetical protein
MARARRSFEDCVAAVDAAGKIGKQRALELLSEVDNRARTMMDKGVPDRYLRAASDLADMELQKAQTYKISAMRDLAARTSWLQRAETEAQGRVAPHVGANLNPLQTKLTLADGLASVLHTIEPAQRHDTVDGHWVAQARRFIGPIGNRLRQLGLLKFAENDGDRYGFAEALWRKDPRNTPDPTITISKNAQAMADAVYPATRLLRERLNALGAYIGDAIGYISHTNWDSDQLARAGGGGPDIEPNYRAWKARDVPRMAESTFEDVLQKEGETPEMARERFIRSIYEATRSGVHMRGTNMAGLPSVGDFIPQAYEGSYNIARAVSHERVIDWKSSRDWADHQKEFGGGHSLYHDIVHTLDVGARRIALMEYLGHNPDANFEILARRLIEQHRNSPDLGRLEAQLQGVRNQLGRLTGRLNVPVSADHANLINGLMAGEAITHLGGVGLTHALAAPLTVSQEMVHHGFNRLESMANVAKALTLNRGSAEVQEALADAGAYTHSYLNGIDRAGNAGDAWRRDGFPGFVSWTAANFMRLTPLPALIDSFHARGVRGPLMSRLGRELGNTFENIERHMQAALRAYGFGPEEWSLIRSSAPTMVEGKPWVTPSTAENVDPAAVEALLRSRGEIGEKAAPEVVARAVQKFQWQLADRLLMYINDAADSATVRPGVREQAIALGETRPGTWSYSVRRAIGQFKMWPLAATMQIIGRDIARSLSNKEMASNIGWVIALTALGGAARMSINDLVAGRPQRDWTNPWVWLAAAAQGGGLGIWGDLLLGETNRMGGGILSTAGGPLVGDVDRFWSIFNRWKADARTETWGKAFQHMWPDLAHWGVQHIPFANLIYLKGTLDYLLWYHLYEAASPGWWERTNRRLQKEQGRTMIGYHPGGHIPWTPFAIGSR